jgi:glycosyltransferase involved in cell wall biosynthesis
MFRFEAPIEFRLAHKMKILITNVFFDGYAGTEVVTRDLAQGLTRAGHRVTIYSPRLGSIADELRGSAVHVTNDLFSLTDAPDIIHGHHHQPLMVALLRFPMTPAIYLCHDATASEDEPCAFPRIRKYLAVDERCRHRIRKTLGETAGDVEIVPNAVDTDRFRPRLPLPEKPRRALLFSNYAHNGTHLPAVRNACRLARLQLDVMGRAMGTGSAHPESALPGYDLVFAKARCALEAMAVGNAVVLCDFAGVGPYVTAADFDSMRAKNFGGALLIQPLSAAALLRQIMRYDASDAQALSARVRTEASLNGVIARWESIYREVIANFRVADLDRAEESRMTAFYLSRWHYYRRRDWELAQIRRLRSIPVLGKAIYKAAKWTLRRWNPIEE